RLRLGRAGRGVAARPRAAARAERERPCHPSAWPQVRAAGPGWGRRWRLGWPGQATAPQGRLVAPLDLEEGARPGGWRRWLLHRDGRGGNRARLLQDPDPDPVPG